MGENRMLTRNHNENAQNWKNNNLSNNLPGKLQLKADLMSWKLGIKMGLDKTKVKEIN